ncbi:MAG: protein-methionine-sulfoxide reductase catalytic subunit MsrP [Alphaproteobacteria bacterium]
MLVKVKQGWELPEATVTPKATYLNRRHFMAGAGAAAALAPMTAVASRFADAPPGPFASDETLTSFDAITQYNNFYEFGTGKDDPAKYAHKLTTEPWTIAVEGECHRPGIYDFDALMKDQPLEERIYRLRCVEAWSMVIPWVGFPLSDWINRFEPTGNAKYIQFDTLYRPREMRGQRRNFIDWPYQEGLRLDEAMHPLTIMAVGLYDQKMPNQNGAPVRLVVPWKYGFKSIKSVVTIRFTEKEPDTAWNLQNPREYGFYSNVNPTVDHPRWSQATERRIGEIRRRKTLMFNGYEEQVASLYAGMDLKKFY